MSRNGDYDVSRGRSSSPQIRRPGCCGGCNDETDSNDLDEEKPRGCTDLLFLIIYVIFSLVMVVIAIFAFCYGNPLRLINGMDSFGNVCGVKNENFGNMTFTGMDMTNKSFVFFFDLSSMDETTKICVEQCPDLEIQNYIGLQEFYQWTSINLCQYDYDLSSLKNDSKPGPNDFVETLCPKLPYPGSIALLKRCIPKPSGMKSKANVLYGVYAYLNGLSIFKQILGDLAVTWAIVLGLTAISFVISFLILCCVHWMSSVMAYIIFCAASLLSLAFTGFLWWTYADLKSMLDSSPPDQILEESARNERAFLTYSIISTIFTVILHLIMVYLRNRVAIVVQLFKEAGKILRAMPCLIIQPLITYVTLTMFFLGWLLVVLFLATADYPTSRNVQLVGGSEDEVISASIGSETNGHVYDDHFNHNVEIPGTSMNRTISSSDISGVTLIEYSQGVWVKYMWWIYLIGLLWCSEFILGCQQMVIASSVSTWYFSRDRTNLKCVITQSVRRLLKYHLGSVALGSFVITVVKIPRLILSFLQRILRKWDDWTCIKWMTKGCTICLSCFEKWLRYIHHNAYTVIAIQCINFCPASRLAFSALLGNALQISIINSIGDFILFLAKCTTAALTGLIAIILFRSNESLYFYAVPVLLTVVFAYFVAHSVISVFEVAIDTLFLCFCEDHNMNFESQNFYAPPSLLQYMREDAPNVLAMGRRYDEAGPIPIKHGLEEVASAEERYPMNVMHHA